MKHVILIGFLVLGSLGILAQGKNKANTTKAPADSSAGVKVVTEDPVENASWKRSGKNGKSEFSDTTLKNDRTVTYDATGNLVISDETNNSLNPNAYPPAIAEYYTQKYPNEKYSVLWTKDKIGNKVYYINRNTETLYFDQEGKFKSSGKVQQKR